MMNILKLTKKEASEKYGEYAVPYDIAKEMDCFKITWNTPYEEAKKLIEDFMTNGIDGDDFYGLDAICVLEFGSLDIEFMSYGVDEKNNFDSGFYCCTQNELQVFSNGYDNSVDDGWESYGFTDLVFNIDLLKDKNKFEEIMYNSMLKLAKENSLTWSKRN